MLIKFNGTTPARTSYQVGVINDNRAVEIQFELDKTIGHVNLAETTAWLNIQGTEFSDKIKMVSEVTNDKLIIKWKPESKHTSEAIIRVQLEFTSNLDNVILQTKIVFIQFANTLTVEEDIEDRFPNVLQDHEKRISVLEEKVQNLEVGNVDLSEINEEIKALNEKYSRLRSDFDNLDTDIDLSGIENQINSLESEIQRVDSIVHKMEEMFPTLSELIDSNVNKINNLETKVNDNTGAIEYLTQNVAEVRNQVYSLGDLIDGLGQDIIDSYNTLLDMIENIYNNDIFDIRNEIDIIYSLLENIGDVDLTEIYDMISQIEEMLDSIDLSDITDRLDNLEDKTENLQNQIDNIDVNVELPDDVIRQNDSPTFNNVATNGDITFSTNNTGLAFNDARIQAGSQQSMFLIQATGNQDTSQRSIVMRPNMQGTAHANEAVLFNNGRFNARELTEANQRVATRQYVDNAVSSRVEQLWDTSNIGATAIQNVTDVKPDTLFRFIIRPTTMADQGGSHDLYGYQLLGGGSVRWSPQVNVAHSGTAAAPTAGVATAFVGRISSTVTLNTTANTLTVNVTHMSASTRLQIVRIG